MIRSEYIANLELAKGINKGSELERRMQANIRAKQNRRMTKPRWWEGWFAW